MTLCYRWTSSIKPVTYLPWCPGQPNGGRHQNCVEAKFNKTNHSFQFNRATPIDIPNHYLSFFECIFLPIQLFIMLSLSSLTLSYKELEILVHAVTLSLLQNKDTRLMDISSEKKGERVGVGGCRERDDQT